MKRTGILSLFILITFVRNLSAQQLVGKLIMADDSFQNLTITLLSSVAVPIEVKNINVEGTFIFDKIEFGDYFIQVKQSEKLLDELKIVVDAQTILDTLVIELKNDYLNLNELVVSGTRSQLFKHTAPIIINTISSKTFENTQSLSLAEGLNFSPGLRMENNCQNCGFNQLRMNGLDGPYTQILINSRKIFSSLAGVYSLEMIPTNMIDKIEVVRGGGSVLYGGNAIAGTVNILTKEPIENSFEIGIQQSLINTNSTDRTININGSIVNKELTHGITFYGFNKNRKPWDANGDEFSEITMLKNTTLGFDAFWHTKHKGKIKMGYFNTSEKRRGGNKFELAPHQADIAEALEHNINQFNLSYEFYSRNKNHKYSLYTALQTVERSSYYGAHGKFLSPQDSLISQQQINAINAYGSAHDISIAAGIQYSHNFSERTSLTAGSEYNYNRVHDLMGGHNRKIDQLVSTVGTYTQLHSNLTKSLTVLIGGRLDYINLMGYYSMLNSYLENKNHYLVAVPRLSTLYSINNNLKFRASYAQGYRAPQAFNEDLHVETIAGSAKMIQFSDHLKMEKSHSFSSNINYTKNFNPLQISMILDGFYTILQNPFLNQNMKEYNNGVWLVEKVNGSGATVYGINFEANMAYKQKWLMQLGFTQQKSEYKKPELLWSSGSNNDFVYTNEILRTPKTYGFGTIQFKPNKYWTISYSGIYTGPMNATHLIQEPKEQLIIKKTPNFWDQNFKIDYKVLYKNNVYSNFFVGIYNLFNEFQKDFDYGILRDASYIYGPSRPRTIYFGLKIGYHE